ncbi:MAG: hypothetical protein N2560_06350 [Ignavibacteria bacterium]|nr:hypothetical protein [Ignavibacteria bacterium]
MGIDKFINDYLDGTLTPEDDNKFRELLENDIEAQEEFDLMLSLNSILKNDAESIQVPKSLEEKVEQRLLATYLSMVATKPSRKGRKIAFALASFFFLFLISIYYINEGNLPHNNTYFISEIVKQQDILNQQIPIAEEQSMPNDSKINPAYSLALSNLSNQSATKTEISAISRYEGVSKNELFQHNVVTISKGLFVEDGFKYDSKVEKDRNLVFLPKEKGNVLSIHSAQLSLDYQNVNKFGYHPNYFNDLPAKGISLTAFSSLPLREYGYNPQNLKSYSSFSQSVGYQISDNFRLGLEFGYFDFDYTQNTTILVPAIQPYAPERKIYDKYIKKEKNETVVLTNGEDNSYPKYVEVTVPIDRKYQHYWGSLFVDYEYPLNKFLSIVGRMNVGATSDGFLGGVVVYTEFQPFNGLTLNFGLENKTYWSAFPSETSTLKSVVGLVYGLSLKFNLGK